MGEKIMYKKKKLNRVILIGANSFIGKAVIKKFKTENIKIVLLKRENIDLEKKQAINKLTNFLKK